MTGLAWKNSLSLLAQPSPPLRAVVHVFLVLMLAYSLAQLTWRVLPEPDELLVPQPATLAGQKRVSGDNQGSQIPQWHLFGRADAKVAAPQPVNLPETQLKLTLRGLIASPDPKEARAIVANSSGKENFYKIGDKLPGNAELKEIHADRIVIQRGARYETLKLPKKSLGMKKTTSATRQGSSSNKSYSLGQYRQALLNNPQQAADLLRIEPARKAGKFVGYRLQPGRDARFLSRYGLMPGDVVTSVNGVVLDSPAKGLGLLNDLKSANTLNIEVERNGVRQRFTLPVN